MRCRKTENHRLPYFKEWIGTMLPVIESAMGHSLGDYCRARLCNTLDALNGGINRTDVILSPLPWANNRLGLSVFPSESSFFTAGFLPLSSSERVLLAKKYSVNWREKWRQSTLKHQTVGKEKLTSSCREKTAEDRGTSAVNYENN